MSIREHYQAALEQQIAHDATADQHGLRSDSESIALEMESRVNEIRRLIDIADALQDTVVSVEGLQQADAHHLMLLEACLNLAQAGTPASAENIQPSLESHLGSTISTEGVAETVRNLLASIRRLLRELWHFISDFFFSIFNEVGRARLRLDYTRTLVDEIDGKSNTRDIVALGNSAYGVITESGVPHDAHSIVVSLNELLHQTKYVREHLTPTLVSIGENFTRTLPNWPDQHEANVEWLESLNKIADAFDPHAIGQAMGKVFPTHNPQFPAGSTLVAAPLPGSRSLSFLSGAKIHPDKMNGSDIERATALQANSIVLVRQRQAGNVDLTKATMEPISNNHMHQILDIVEKVLDEVEAAVRSNVRARMERMGRSLEDSMNRINSEAGSDTARLRRGLRYATVYSEWVQSPFVQLMAHDLMVSRSMMSFVAHHCAAYR